MSHWTLDYLPGWVRAQHHDGTTAYARMKPTGPAGRMEVRHLVVTRPHGIRARTLRAVPLELMTSLVNCDARALVVVASPDGPQTPRAAPGELCVYFESAPLLGASKQLRACKSDPPEAPVLPAHSGRLTVEFLTAVAENYRWRVSRGETSPALAIAAQARVPVATVRRWIVMARARGHLAKGHRGRVG